MVAEPEEPAQAAPPDLGVVVRETLAERGRNLIRNFEAGRLRVVRGVLAAV